MMNVWQSADQKTGHYFDLGLRLADHMIQEGFNLYVLCIHSVIHAQTHTQTPCPQSEPDSPTNRCLLEITDRDWPLFNKGQRHGLQAKAGKLGRVHLDSARHKPGEGEPCRRPIAFLEEGILAPGQPDGHWCSRHESYHWVKWDVDTQWDSKLLPGKWLLHFLLPLIKLSCFGKQYIVSYDLF